MTIRLNLHLIRSIVLKYKLIPLSIAMFFFFLQSRFLHIAANPGTDEGVYAEAGRMIMRGFVPHKDFPLFHMPLLPILTGVGLKIHSEMYQLRLIYLLINCLATIPLYITLKKFQDNTFAALLAVLFYLTYHEMVHHDFRFLAIRQLANDLFICFFYLGIVQIRWRYTTILQTLLSIFSVLLFLPTSLNLLFISVATIFSQEDSKVRIGLLKHYTYIGIITLAVLACYFIFIPSSLNQTIFEQIGRDPVDRLSRVKDIIYSQYYESDKFFYGLSILSLVTIAITNSRVRYYAVAMLGVVLISLFLPSSFFPHYLSAAGPAFAFGIFSFGMLTYRIFEKLRLLGLIIIYSTYLLVFTYQFSIVSESLKDEWLGNKHHDYIEIISVLSRTSDPLIAVKPIFAVEAKKELLKELEYTYMRSPISKRIKNHEYDTFARRACTIFLDYDASSQLPKKIIRRWIKKYSLIYENMWGKILVTNNPNCKNYNF